MRLLANLPYKLWIKIMSTPIYLYNQTPQPLNDWKSLYEAFYSYVFNKKKVSKPQKPPFHHLRVFECKAYILIKSKKDLLYRQKCH